MKAVRESLVYRGGKSGATLVLATLAILGGQLSAQTVSSVGISADALIERPAVLDVTGPMTMKVAGALCAQVPTALTGLPPGSPAGRESKMNDSATAEDLAYLSSLRLHELQSQFCTPVIDGSGASSATGLTLPVACTQPPEAGALVNPIHPLADMTRQDVAAAATAYSQATARVDALRQQCLELANERGISSSATASTLPSN